MTTMTARTAAHPDADKLPLGALLALAMTGFLALLTETLPAGMLLRISAGMGISETLAGQFVTLYAIGSVAAAVPLTAATQGWRRRPLLLAALAAILVFNTLTALTDNYIAALAARFLAGMAGGLIWGMLAGYARRLVADPLKGRALAIAGVGAPIALSLGVPLGTLLGDALGWRSAFGAISLLTLAVMAWILAKVPDFAGQPAGRRQGVGPVLRSPGLRPVLAVLVLWVLAHSILYTYVAPLLGPAGLSGQTDRVLLTFGLASLAGVWISGLLIDRRLRALTLLSLAGFALAVLALGLAGTHAPAVYVAVAAWGVAFGGSPTLLQTASAEAAGPGADVAQSILATVWNVAIAGGGIVGGLLLDASGAGALPWAALGLAIAALLLAGSARAHGFPAEPRHARRA
ncbi:MFS transporter [Achromobacter sp. Marseille-Q0513]|uniref:MFS transporter n=1 Tax=Achromobacter sp. Marseille-Q0513 TaxID=2829161 RepID=UPI001B8EF885|nr:MFS transporter [Achromobacter sp. Marseille-Q0513]MBR8654781.1 MFS transporter [Achromobacter sp. Marseille-Q0513]